MDMAKVYWDSACFLAWFNRESDIAPACDEILTEAEQGRVQIVASAVALPEITHIKHNPRLNQEQQEQIRSFFDRSYISIRDVTAFIGRKAQQLMWSHPKLKAWDAVHIATALFYDVRVFHTKDQCLIDYNGLIEPNLIRICRPTAGPQMKLDLQIIED